MHIFFFISLHISVQKQTLERFLFRNITGTNIWEPIFGIIPFHRPIEIAGERCVSHFPL